MAEVGFDQRTHAADSSYRVRHKPEHLNENSTEDEVIFMCQNMLYIASFDPLLKLLKFVLGTRRSGQR